MRRYVKHLEVASSSHVKRNRSSRLLALSVLLALAGVAAGCGAASPTSHQSTGQLAVSVPVGAAEVGVAYNAVPSVSGGTAPYTFVLYGGSLPPGVHLNPQTGSITGVPLVSGNYGFSLSVTDLPLSD